MWVYRSLRGRHFDLEELTPGEQSAYLRLLQMAGGGDVVNPEGPLQELMQEVDDSEDLVPEPEVFSAACQAVLAGLAAAGDSEAVKNGAFAKVVEDLEARVAQVGGFRAGDEIFDPSSFLYEIRNKCRDLREFSEYTGIEYSQASKVLRNLASLGLPKLKEVAARTRRAFEAVELDQAPPTLSVSSRDRQFGRLGQRVQSLAAAMHGQEEVDEAIRSAIHNEFRARGLGGSAAAEEALDRARHYVNKLYERSSPLLERILIVPLDVQSESREKLGWLFLAQDFGWFDELDFFVILPRRWPPRPNSMVDVFVDDSAEGAERSDSASSTRLFEALVRAPLFSPRREASAEDGRAAVQRFRLQSARLIHLARLMLKDPVLRPLAWSRIDAWFRALDWERPSFDSFIALSGPSRFRVATLGRADVAHAQNAHRANRERRAARRSTA